MHEDQVWPQRSDFGIGGGFQELGLRSRDAFCFTALALALVSACNPYFLNLNSSKWCLLMATRCEILVGSNALVARLGLESGQQLLQDFIEDAEDPESNVSLRYLRSALLWSQAWLGLHTDFSANLLMERPGQPHIALHIEPNQVTRQSEERPGQSLGLTLALVPGSAGSQQELFFALRRLLRQNLPAKVAFCPTPIYLDGQRLDGSLTDHTSLPLYTRYYLGASRRDCLAVHPPVAAHYYRLESQPAQVWPRPRFCLPQARVHTFSLAGELPPRRNGRWPKACPFRSGAPNWRPPVSLPARSR